MKKHLLFSLTLVAFIFLSACSEHKPVVSYQELRTSLISLNSSLSHSSTDDITVLPFTEGYLQLRHALLSSSLNEPDVMAHKELDYLRIQERYPERYLPWPSHIPVLKNVEGRVSVEELDLWLKFVITKLKEADESNIRLNRFERDAIIKQLEDSNIDAPSRSTLLAYLNDYKSRAMLGLHQLPNGKEWYQSKLNFYGAIQESPNKVLAMLSKIDEKKSKSIVLNTMPNTQQPYILEFLPANCQRISGLNWRDEFINVPSTVAKCTKAIEQHKALIVTLMAVDLGIHYQGWSQKQAFVALNSKLALNEQQAQQLIANIVYFPATIFAAYPHFLKP
ncbi:hypothetical protein [Pseudoalteromonas sp. OF7H-1]|uniref:hypothetical protein n=1 Tax=Pseudoalteromonas sp. OF7H-1 TaxID=2917755 RepID=UPI001EF69D5F|nr:hypothetical protein [Pseudoalteromonas sp. OF7H-1]MCG7538651.1 hypothetical protein [Pseudoalteromonas sp. OF7H-1]